LLWDIDFNGRCRIGSDVVSIKVSLADLPDDWNRATPADVGDFNVEIRWKTTIHGLTEN
jgi:hypothetical protein